ncbi:unnamed protein product [Brugia timori]|uniref:Uncharacterized protein n=1 Tax=Brugia timori TaxID=42155 RepID=A0A0R3QHE5_9BILA|nr:unnamed protein product [Brugia timori]
MLNELFSQQSLICYIFINLSLQLQAYLINKISDVTLKVCISYEML